MTAPDARAIAHQAIGCECAMLSGKHDEICDRVTAALASARNEALEEIERDLFISIEHGDAQHRQWLRDKFAEYFRALKDRP